MYKQELLLLLSSKGTICILNKDNSKPICTNVDEDEHIKKSDQREISFSPYDTYVTNADAVFYNCSKIECVPINLYSISQVIDPNLDLRACDHKSSNCEKIRYNYFTVEDRLRFLNSSIGKKSFYIADCLVYGGDRVCHEKRDESSHTQLQDIGRMARPNETGVLAMDDLVCEHSSNNQVICDINSYVPVATGLLKVKDTVDYKNVLLKASTFLIPLKLVCEDECLLNGLIPTTRRYSGFPYRDPGGDVYRCYYAKRQQICKRIYNIHDDLEYKHNADF